MELTIERAEEIRKLFGPCTVVYECFGRTELQDLVDEGMTCQKFIEHAFTSDSVMVDKMQWADHIPGLSAEHDSMVGGIIRRLKEAGYEDN